MVLILRTSKLDHENLVKLHGITISPLQMVLEYVPASDLHDVLKSRGQALSTRWKLKAAIDCAAGIKYGTGEKQEGGAVYV